MNDEPRKINMGEAIEAAFRVLREETDVTIDDPPEMTPAEADWVTWAECSRVDTGGYCSCGHEGLGVGWHLDDCRGASFALRNKVMELMRTVDTLRSMGRLSGDTTP